MFQMCVISFLQSLTMLFPGDDYVMLLRGKVVLSKFEIARKRKNLAAIEHLKELPISRGSGKYIGWFELMVEKRVSVINSPRRELRRFHRMHSPYPFQNYRCFRLHCPNPACPLIPSEQRSHALYSCYVWNKRRSFYSLPNKRDDNEETTKYWEELLDCIASVIHL